MLENEDFLNSVEQRWNMPSLFVSTHAQYQKSHTLVLVINRTVPASLQNSHSRRARLNKLNLALKCQNLDQKRKVT